MATSIARVPWSGVGDGVAADDLVSVWSNALVASSSRLAPNVGSEGKVGSKKSFPRCNDRL